ncbi:hypothetical protein P344_06105 [Spiroplasma mirum ATCC 29335]|uniref:Uncharacterized protein n=1 Tax=Spiroplasma mirum ATCC 29335 TaxID=838561 RepID=W6AMH8_9MOLU|nr:MULTISPECIES: hypothetical protein [Spiroplasma]AHI58528.1 hypothetical protein P344_06105 [Spiroplasma mirum ATCC 29335]AKM53452.1 hypothetical protein SATRI_v1c10910 [Spiroplasma atrichopogonis]
MPNPNGELLQLKQASLPTNEFMNESMIAKAKANPDDYANFFWSAAILPISNINSNIL